mgnify:CR=1 FL=1
MIPEPATGTNQPVAPSTGFPGNQVRNLGEVKNLARVRLNGQDLGVLWTDPWEVEISSNMKSTGNLLEIDVANLWPNRLIGDLQYPETGIQNNKWPQWLLDGKPQPGKRTTFTTYNPYKADTPLLPSGLLGPVKLEVEVE